MYSETDKKQAGTIENRRIKTNKTAAAAAAAATTTTTNFGFCLTGLFLQTSL